MSTSFVSDRIRRAFAAPPMGPPWRLWSVLQALALGAGLLLSWAGPPLSAEEGMRSWRFEPGKAPQKGHLILANHREGMVRLEGGHLLPVRLAQLGGEDALYFRIGAEVTKFMLARGEMVTLSPHEPTGGVSALVQAVDALGTPPERAVILPGKPPGDELPQPGQRRRRSFFWAGPALVRNDPMGEPLLVRAYATTLHEAVDRWLAEWSRVLGASDEEKLASISRAYDLPVFARQTGLLRDEPATTAPTVPRAVDAPRPPRCPPGVTQATRRRWPSGGDSAKEPGAPQKTRRLSRGR